MNVFEVIFAKIGIDTSDFNKGLDESSQKASSFSSKVGAGLKTVAKVGVAAVGAATTAIAGFSAASVKVGASFDSSMSQVAATMAENADKVIEYNGKEMKSIDALREYAQKMGSETAFSASQAADALNYMALAGYDAQTSMNMLPNVLNLAAAGGMELATASDMVTDASSALGLDIKETTVLVDQMAKASSITNTSVSQLGDAILTVGGTAKNLAYGTEELTGVLGALADNGIKGAEAGTHLRNIMLALNPTTDKAVAAFEQLGVNAYTAEGELRGLDIVFGEISDAMEGMSDQEKTSLLSDMFNKTDLAAVNALLATTEARWDEIYSGIDSARGAAEEMKNTQLDNLNGDITLFKSALEGAQIAISDGLTPGIRKFVKFGSSGLSRLTDSFKKGGLTGAMKEFGGILSEGIAMIIDYMPTMVSAGIELLGALAKGLLENAPLLFNSAIEIVVKLAKYISDGLPEMIPTIIDIILQIVDILTKPDNLMMLVDASIAIIIALAEGLMNALPKLIEKAPVIIANLVNAIVQATPKLINAAIQILVVLVAGIVENLGDLISAGMEIVGAVIVGIVEWLANLVKIGADMGNSIREGLMDFIDAAKNWGKDLIDNFIDGIKEKWTNLKKSVSDVAQTVKDYLGFSEPDKGPLSNFHTYAPDMMKLFAEGIEDNARLLTDAIGSTFDIHPMIQTEMSKNGPKTQVAGAGIGGDIVIPLYIDGSIWTEVVVKANQVNDYVTGGRG